MAYGTRLKLRPVLAAPRQTSYRPLLFSTSHSISPLFVILGLFLALSLKTDPPSVASAVLCPDSFTEVHCISFACLSQINWPASYSVLQPHSGYLNVHSSGIPMVFVSVCMGVSVTRRATSVFCTLGRAKSEKRHPRCAAHIYRCTAHIYE